MNRFYFQIIYEQEFILTSSVFQSGVLLTSKVHTADMNCHCSKSVLLTSGNASPKHFKRLKGTKNAGSGNGLDGG